MSSFGKLTLAIAAIAGAGFACYFFQLNQQNSNSAPAPIPSAASTAVASTPLPSSSPSIRFPIPSENPTNSNAALRPVPPIDESDETIETALIDLFGKKRVESLFNLKEIVRRIVATVDGATGRKQPSSEVLPFKPMDTDFKVINTSDGSIIDQDGFPRYAPYVNLIQSVDAQKLVQVYVHFYPVFQTAHLELGEQGYFNDRLIDAIDNALETPEVKGPVKVLRLTSHSKYKFVDDRLESLSAAQKLLIRMGNNNSQIVLAKLRQIREQLVHSKIEPKQ